MITQDNFKSFLLLLGFEQNGDVLSKHFLHTEGMLKVDFNKKQLIYPEAHGLIINERQTCNFSQNENFVVFECVHRLLAKGYKPEHIELEPKWKVGHGASGGRADILVKYQQGKPMLIIECKTAGKEFEKAWKDIQNDGGQLFSYAQQIQETEFLCLYASSFSNNDINVYFLELIMRKKKQYLNDIAPQMAQKNINIDILKSVKIPVPPLPVQEKLVSEVEKLEQEISKNQKIVDESPNLKQQVMKRYL
jgi:hypothetical protein